MRILFTGRGTSGSWKIRGEQLGGTLGAVVLPNAGEHAIRQADIVVLVKRPGPDLIPILKKLKKRWVWDVVDFYPQPACTKWGREKSVDWVKKQIKAFNPTAVIWPNARMENDCATGCASSVIYHHYNPSVVLRSLRADIQTVAYEGSPKYFVRWGKIISQLCAERGWELVINPGPNVSRDVMVAYRDSAFNGYAQKHWKSNVKLANAHAAGIPFVGAVEDGYLETATGREFLCDTTEEIAAAFDSMQSVDKRIAMRKAYLDSRIPISLVATQYRAFLESVA